MLALFGMVFGRYKAKTLSLSVSWGVEFPRSGYRVNEFGLDHDTIQSSHSDLSPSITMFAFMRAAAASRISDCNSVIVIVLILRGALLGFPLGR